MDKGSLTRSFLKSLFSGEASITNRTSENNLIRKLVPQSKLVGLDKEKQSDAPSGQRIMNQS